MEAREIAKVVAMYLRLENFVHDIKFTDYGFTAIGKSGNRSSFGCFISYLNSNTIDIPYSDSDYIVFIFPDKKQGDNVTIIKNNGKETVEISSFKEKIIVKFSMEFAKTE